MFLSSKDVGHPAFLWFVNVSCTFFLNLDLLCTDENVPRVSLGLSPGVMCTAPISIFQCWSQISDRMMLQRELRRREFRKAAAVDGFSLTSYDWFDSAVCVPSLRKQFKNLSLSYHEKLVYRRPCGYMNLNQQVEQPLKRVQDTGGWQANDVEKIGVEHSEVCFHRWDAKVLGICGNGEPARTTSTDRYRCFSSQLIGCDSKKL